jgi:hypothetical protein
VTSGAGSDSSAGEATAGREPATDGPPLLRVVKGEPTAEELAALVAVVAARAAGSGEAAAPSPQSAWTDRSRYVRSPMSPGPGAWQASAFPR